MQGIILFQFLAIRAIFRKYRSCCSSVQADSQPTRSLILSRVVGRETCKSARFLPRLGLFFLDPWDIKGVRIFRLLTFPMSFEFAFGWLPRRAPTISWPVSFSLRGSSILGSRIDRRVGVAVAVSGSVASVARCPTFLQWSHATRHRCRLRADPLLELFNISAAATTFCVDVVLSCGSWLTPPRRVTTEVGRIPQSLQVRQLSAFPSGCRLCHRVCHPVGSAESCCPHSRGRLLYGVVCRHRLCRILSRFHCLRASSSPSLGISSLAACRASSLESSQRPCRFSTLLSSISSSQLSIDGSSLSSHACATKLLRFSAVALILGLHSRRYPRVLPIQTLQLWTGWEGFSRSCQLCVKGVGDGIR